MRATLAGTFAVVACFAIFFIATAFALGYGTTQAGIDREVFLAIQLGASLLMALGIVLSGWWSDYSSPRKVLICGFIGTNMVGLLFGPASASGSVTAIFLILSLALFSMGFFFV